MPLDGLHRKAQRLPRGRQRREAAYWTRVMNKGHRWVTTNNPLADGSWAHKTPNEILEDFNAMLSRASMSILVPPLPRGFIRQPSPTAS